MTIRYPLRKLKRLREYELEEAAAELRKITEEAQALGDRIRGCNQAISRVSSDLARKEEETRRVHPELRLGAASYIKAQEIERQAFEARLVRVEALRDEAYARLLASKQAAKMIDRHEARYTTAVAAADVRKHGNEADELFLVRGGAA